MRAEERLEKLWHAENSDKSRREKTTEDSNESRQVVHVTDENSGESRGEVTMPEIVDISAQLGLELF